MWNGRITSVHKAPYELGVADATANSLQEGTLAIEGARHYAPVTQHLIEREKFFANYSKYLSDLSLPERASDYYNPLRDKLKEVLFDFDQNYEKVKKRNTAKVV
jgi:hypothetical protein